MRGLGRLVSMLNPLDQSATQQILKSAGKGFMNRAAALGHAGARQVLSGGYFRGKSLRYGAKQGFFSGRTGATIGKTTDIAGARKTVTALAGAWAGLNALAPGSFPTQMMNMGAGAVGVGMLGRGPVRNRWGPGAEKKLYLGAGGVGAASLLGII